MGRAGDEVVESLVRAGVAEDDARALRRASRVLRRWYEAECGGSDAYSAWCVVRGRLDGGEFVYDDAGEPHVERHDHAATGVVYTSDRINDAGRAVAVADLEAEALIRGCTARELMSSRVDWVAGRVAQIEEGSYEKG